ncbi:MAG: bifunctional helix-turn-helix domain-containing protein/methylated-DNA--[protein]-cysteine S-methyltransferase [Pseudomonadota bacterium]
MAALEQIDIAYAATAADEKSVGDYDRVRRGVSFLHENWRDHPDLDALAQVMGLSAGHCQKLFKRWAGLSPKEFVQVITIDHARDMLRSSASLLETAHEVGLSGAGRLHDLFVDHEAMTPGDYKRRGDGLTIRYGFHVCPFGRVLAMMTERGLCGLAFCDAEDNEETALADMTQRWPAADYVADGAATEVVVRQIFDVEKWDTARPIKLVLIGSDFEIDVWRALLKIPAGRAVSYSDIADHVGRHGASRAVGSAVGRNPISFVVPCHRAMRKDGSLGGYHWGITRKQAIIGWERGRMVDRAPS